MDRKGFIKTGGMAASGLIFPAAFSTTKTENKMQNNLNIRNADMANICKTCGTRYAPEKFKSDQCPVCFDDRQYLREYGQEWLSYDALRKKHTVKINLLCKNIYEIYMQPSFAIGQKAHLITTSAGNILWDCIPLIDDASASYIKEKGGLKAIAISHPHYYSLMAEWADYFNCPIYLHSDDKKWVMDSESKINFWDGDRLSLSKDMTLIRTGGHFPGSSVLHYKSSRDEGMLFSGDSLYLSRDKKHISAMYSYPNVIPLSPGKLFNIFETVAELKFDSLYGAFEWQNIHNGAKTIFNNSLKRYQRIYQLRLARD